MHKHHRMPNPELLILRPDKSLLVSKLKFNSLFFRFSNLSLTKVANQRTTGLEPNVVYLDH
jgi:hypothetical protein